MTKIRFYYTGTDLNEGKKHFKSTSEYGYVHLEEMMNIYKSDLKNNSNIPHPARCPGMNTIKKTGWVTFNQKEIKGEDALGQTQSAHGFVKETFINYPDSNDYVIYKLESKWNVNIPSGYYLMSIPTLYHTKTWFSLPGMFAAENSLMGFEQLNSFIIMHKDEIIPVGSPIAQWILIKKEICDVTIDFINDDDKEAINNRDILTDIRMIDHNKYKLLKQSEFFRNWEINYG
jgi:hypothetical protein